MNRADIIRMAREAGFDISGVSGQLPNEVTVEDFICTEELERFAALVAAAEREECAKACEAISEDRWALYKGRKPYTGQEPGRASDFVQGVSGGADVCAAAIRARGTP